MKVTVLKTNGGPHPPEKWAEQTAEQLVDVIQIEPTYPNYESALQAKNLLKDKLIAVLIKHHTNVQTDERNHLKARASRMMEPLDPTDHVDKAAADVIQGCIATTIFAAHFNKPEVQAFVRNTIGSHFVSAMHIERSWHASTNPENPSAQQFRATHHPGA